MKIINVVGARPNFMKMAPLHRAMLASGGLDPTLIHTGQHYDEKMSDIFFKQLEMPVPDVFMGVGGGSHAQQTARIMTAFEDVVKEFEPDLVLVAGDVDSTLACGLTTVKMGITLGHIEAGLRSFDRRMPEEINRIVTDSISDHLFVTEQSGLDNLKNEGVDDGKVHFCGNLMIDSLVHFREKASRTEAADALGVEKGEFALVTMHRPSNVDTPGPLAEVVRILETVARRMPVVFPLHPRTRSRLEQYSLFEQLNAANDLTIVPPTGYLEFLDLMQHAKVVVTDSGGIQEETSFLGVPCLTLRENTERPVTLTLGTNRLVELNADLIDDLLAQVASEAREAPSIPLWDGHAADRIVKTVQSLVTG